MSESTPPRSRMDRMRDLWFLYVVLGTLAGAVVGGITVGFTRFTIYYLAEQSSIATLQALNASSAETANRLTTIDVAQRDQKYANQTVTEALKDLNAHVHALDERADNDRKTITNSLDVQSKNSEQILLLLQPKVPPHK